MLVYHLVFPQICGSICANIGVAFEIFHYCFELLFCQILPVVLHMQSTLEIAKFDQETSSNGYLTHES